MAQLRTRKPDGQNASDELKTTVEQKMRRIAYDEQRRKKLDKIVFEFHQGIKERIYKVGIHKGKMSSYIRGLLEEDLRKREAALDGTGAYIGENELTFSEQILIEEKIAEIQIKLEEMSQILTGRIRRGVVVKRTNSMRGAGAPPADPALDHGELILEKPKLKGRINEVW